MNTYTYRNGQVNEASFILAGGLSKLKYQIDFRDGMGTATLGAVTVGAVDISNVNATVQVVYGVTTTGSIAIISLMTAGTLGTQEAIDGARFRVRTTATLSDSRVLIQDTFLYVSNPAYDPV
jgi:hypothetical protein